MTLKSVLVVIGAILTACAGAIAPVGTHMAAQSIEVGVDPSTATKIKHVVIMIQENRSFDNLFATFPGADGVQRGKIHTGAMVPLAKRDLLDRQDMQHSYRDYVIDYNHGQMDGFDLATTASGNTNNLLPYQFVAPDQIAVYWTLASRYTLADHMFTTAGSDSFIGHQDLVAGGTQINADDAIMDGPNAQPWGCDAPAGTVTSLITSSDRFTPSAGPFPCLSYTTLADLLSRKNVTWRYYCSHPTDDWNAFEAIRAVRYSPHWRANISTPQTNILKDIAGGSLAGVSWVVPTADYSDHPGEPRDYGPDWIGNIVNAIGESPYWSSTAIIVLWDDWGGFYDHVAPRQYPFGELGFRVPAIIVSPYARAGYVAHTQYEFGSILRFIEDNWSLGRLGTSDVRANSISGAFNVLQKPRRYVPVRVAHPPSFFLSLPVSNRPLDSE